MGGGDGQAAETAERCLSGYVLSAGAEKDLGEIFDYLDEQSVFAAEDYDTRFRDGFRHLAAYPRSGYRQRWMPKGIRGWVVTPYVVYYFEKEGTVVILAVLHGKRDLPEVLQQRHQG